MNDHCRHTGPKRAKRLTISPIHSLMSNRQSSRLHIKTPSMENMDDDLILPLKPVSRKKKPKIIVSSDSDDTIIIDDDEENQPPSPSPKPIKKKVVHRRKLHFLSNIDLILSFLQLK